MSLGESFFFFLFFIKKNTIKKIITRIIVIIIFKNYLNFYKFTFLLHFYHNFEAINSEIYLYPRSVKCTLSTNNHSFLSECLLLI